MIGVFRQKNPGNLFVLFLIGIALKLPAFFGIYEPIIKPHDNAAYLYFVEFLKPFAHIFPGIYTLIAYLFIFLQTYLLGFFINNDRLMNKVNFLPGMAYMLLTSLIPEFNRLSSPLLVSTIFISVFIILFAAHNEKITQGKIFNAGLLLGLALLFFPPALFFIVWAFTILAMLRPFRLNEWFLMLLGILTPFYFLAIFLFLNDHLHWKYFFNGFEIGLAREKYTIWHAGGLFLVLMPLFAGIFYVQSLSGRMLIHVRKAWILFVLYGVICLVISFFNIGSGMENWVLMMLPIAALHGFGYFNAEWRLYPKLAFWLSVVFIISSQLFSGLW